MSAPDSSAVHEDARAVAPRVDAASAQIDPSAFALTGRGLRFALARTESEYRDWQVRTAIPHQRVSMFGGALGWALLLAYWVALGLPSLGAAAICAGIALGVSALRVPTLRRPQWSRFVMPSAALSSATTSTLGVGLVWLSGVGPYPLVALILVIVGGQFTFNISRLRPALATSAALPYLVLHVGFAVREAVRGSMSGGELSLHVSFVAYTLATGLTACVATERSARERFRQERIIDLQGSLIDEQRRRSDRLLLSILPASIAERLKASSDVIADRIDEVTVIFVDVVGFTTLAASVSPESLVDLLDEIFRRFDHLAERFGVEKIKTIGDAYMAVVGLPEPRADHAFAAAQFALAAKAALAEYAAESGRAIQVRVGISSGTVVAGVIGTRKFAYDLWGDTVNTAARMESHGVPGQVQVSESTFVKLRDRYRFEPRGVIDVKGKGPMPAWLLLGSA